MIDVPSPIVGWLIILAAAAVALFFAWQAVLICIQAVRHGILGEFWRSLR